MTIPAVKAETFWGSTVTTTEVACLVALESRLRLRYLAERIWVALSLRIACRIYGKSSSSRPVVGAVRLLYIFLDLRVRGQSYDALGAVAPYVKMPFS